MTDDPVNTAQPTPEPASFRDPDSRVWRLGERLFRAVDQDTRQVYERLDQAGWLARHIEAGRLPRTRMLTSAECAALGAGAAGAAGVLEHEALPVVSYPYEWCFSMLADAGLLHLELQEELLDHRASLKDATAFNVLFARQRPCFIDFGSFETPHRLDTWYAYGQFCRMFLFPLLLKLQRGLPLPGLFLPHLDGVDVSHCRTALGLLRSWSPSLLLDVGLQHYFQSKSGGGVRRANPAGPGDPEAQKLNLRRLRRKLTALKQAYRPAGLWSEYRSTHSYSDEAETRKQAFVDAFMARERPATVLDLGCNTGVYSRLAAGRGARVIATDQDHDSIECLYRELQSQPADIHPLVANVATPSPGVGFLGEERAPLLPRARSDAVLALALIHHLLVSARLPLDAVIRLFAELSARDLVVEYVDVGDEMFQTLLAHRTDDFAWLTLPVFRQALAARFTETAIQEVKPGKRWMIAARRRG